MMGRQRKRLTLQLCEQPPDDADPKAWIPPSWEDAIANIPANKQPAAISKMKARMEFLEEGGQLRAPDFWNTESDLPDGKKFYAIKADRLRAYGWFSIANKGVFHISHFAFKRGEKLAAHDTSRVIANWRVIEEKKR